MAVVLLYARGDCAVFVVDPFESPPLTARKQVVHSLHDDGAMTVVDFECRGSLGEVIVWNTLTSTRPITSAVQIRFVRYHTITFNLTSLGQRQIISIF